MQHVQVQNVTEAHQKIVKARAILQFMKGEDESKDSRQLHMLILEAETIRLKVPQSVYQHEYLLCGKELLKDSKMDTWSELLVREGQATTLLPRRLSYFDTSNTAESASGESPTAFRDKSQEQLIFEGEEMLQKLEQRDALAKLMLAVLKQKDEIPASLVDEVQVISELLPLAPATPISGWTEEKLLRSKLKVRGSGKLVRQFCLQPIGIHILAELDAVIASFKKNKAFSDLITRLQADVAGESWDNLMKSNSVSDVQKLKLRTLKTQKECKGMLDSMDEVVRKMQAVPIATIHASLDAARSRIIEFAHEEFDVAIGTAIKETWPKLTTPAGKKKKKTHAELLELFNTARENMHKARTQLNDWKLEDLQREEAQLPQKCRLQDQLMGVLDRGFALLAGDDLADEAPGVEEFPHMFKVINAYPTNEELVTSIFCNMSTCNDALSFNWNRMVLPNLKKGAEAFMSDLWTTTAQRSELVLIGNVHKQVMSWKTPEAESPVSLRALLGKLKKTEANALTTLDVDLFDNLTTQMDHMINATAATIGEDEESAKITLGKHKLKKAEIGVALQLTLLLRSCLVIADLADRPLAEFAVNVDNQFNGLFPNMMEKFSDATAKCRTYYQAVLKSSAEAAAEGDDLAAFHQKVQFLGSCPLLLQAKAVEAATLISPKVTTMQSLIAKITEAGLGSIKDVRVAYRSQDGLSLFQHVKEMDKARACSIHCGRMCVSLNLAFLFNPLWT